MSFVFLLLTTGFGKRRGTANARTPRKILWLRRMRVLRRMLKKYREAKKIDKHIYHELYIQAKGNKFKTKRNLMETIHRMKTEKNKETQLEEQAAARKAKANVVKMKKEKKAQALEATPKKA